MPKKFFTIAITSFVVLIVLGAVFWGYLIFSGRAPSGGGDEILGGLSPFGSGEEISGGGEPGLVSPNTGTTTIVSDGSGEGLRPKTKTLFRLSEEAASGISFTKNVATGTPRVRFVERATGHVVEIDIETKKSEKISNYTIPKIYEGVFTNGGEVVLLRYLSGNGDIESLLINLNTRGNQGEPRGIFLPINTLSAVSSPSGRDLLYVSRGVGGGTIILRNIDTGKETRVFSSPLTEWVLGWPSETSLRASTKPSARVGGFSYALSREGGGLNKLFGGIPGLTTLTSPLGKYVLIGGSVGGKMAFGIFDNQERKLEQFGKVTLPEKCAWLKNGSLAVCGSPKNPPRTIEYPDAWYQGLVSFSDEFFVVSTAPKNFFFFINPTEAAGETVTLDITSPVFDDSGNFFAFINKRGGEPWLLDLTNWWPVLGD